MKYTDLLKNIEHTHTTFFNHSANAINQSLTIRNWVIGYYIVEYEQKGNDRAKYGEKLLLSLAKNLNQRGLSNRNLNLFRKFYLVYPEIMQLLTAQSDLNQFPILQLATAELKNANQFIQLKQKKGIQLPDKQLVNNNNSYLISLIKKLHLLIL